MVPDGTALDKALEIAGVIGSNGPLAVEAIKKPPCGPPMACRRPTRRRADLEIGWPIFSTADAAEGMRAFAEKRPPVYTRT